MESLGGIIKKENGLARSWDKYKNPNSKLIYNEVLGVCSPELEQQAIRFGWIVKRAGRWMVARERIIASNGGQGYSYNKGDTISIINRNFMAYKENLRNANSESLDKTAPQEDDFDDKVKQLF